MDDDLFPRLRAVCDLNVAEVREFSGRHEYDGAIQDLSPAGVRSGLARLAQAAESSDPLEDAHDEAHLGAFEDQARIWFGELELHRRNPLVHLFGLDLAGYDRDYAPQPDRDRARLAHLAGWPQAVDAAIAALDQVNAPVAVALLDGIKGLAAGIPDSAPDDVAGAARAAHERLVTAVSGMAANGDPDPALGGPALAALMGSPERMEVDLGQLAERADSERDRLRERLAASCARIDPARPPLEIARELVQDHPDASGVITAARQWTQRAIDFTRARDLAPYHDGQCLVGPAPPSRRWAMAMMSWAAPGEPEGPSWYHITPPDESWPEREAAEWLEVFSATTLPGITVHEVAPGHFSHGRALRHAATPVRRVLLSGSFAEGWAHYAEELCVEQGFGGDDPRFEIGVWLEALVRVTRLACAIGVHTADMSVEEGARRFEADTQLAGPAALSEARRATFDPTYGCYTWGKLTIMDLREQARQQWGDGYSLQRFHAAMLALGSPPLGLLGTAIVRGLAWPAPAPPGSLVPGAAGPAAIRGDWARCRWAGHARGRPGLDRRHRGRDNLTMSSDSLTSSAIPASLDRPTGQAAIQASDGQVTAVREFNRFYTGVIGLLREGLLDTPYSLTEARVLFELARQDAVEAAELRRWLDIDAGYLSRLLARFEADGLVSRARSAADGRRQVIGLTGAGRAVQADLDTRSGAQIRGLLAPLTPDTRQRLTAAMATIREIIGPAPPPAAFVLRPPAPGDLGWVVQSHGSLYAAEYGFDASFEALVARIVADYASRDDHRGESAWIAELGGEPAGCVFCMRKTPATAQLRLLLVEPRARGLGMGGRLVAECVSFARRAGYREMVLWTNDVLHAARRIYQRAGFRLAGSEPHHSFGHDLVGQDWRLPLA